MPYPLLKSIDKPADVRALDRADLEQLAEELRNYLLDTIAANGGHLGAGLGAVELTIALHYVFSTPDDRLVWDVGHQAYPHKILTGRREELGTIRKWDGLAPFPRRAESEYDTFGVGHAGTSIGAALGMAIASQRTGANRKVVTITGDGAMTCGMAYEAMNNAGDLRPDLLVILNDNRMSISPNVGALTNYLARTTSGRFYSALREGGKQVLKHMPPAWEFAKRFEEHAKGMLVPGALFEALGFNYFGPIDGHDLPTLVQTLENLRGHTGPRLLHVITRKGKGYRHAEADQVAYHGVKPFDPKVGIKKSGKPSAPTYSQVFGKWLCDMAGRDPRLMGITPAMREGSGLVEFEKRFPDRYLDVAIAEQQSVTVAAGMACDGLKPVVAIYSTFLQRAYDQLIHDVALQNLPVLFAIDRAGVVGADGPTHHGAFDLSYLRCVPNMVVMAPADENETRQMLYTGFQLDQPTAVRYPRGNGPGVPVEDKMEALPIGKAQTRRRGKGMAILAFGAMLAPSLEVGEELDATVVNMRFVKPLDHEMIRQLASEHEMLVTVEDNVVAGGAGSAVGEYLSAARIHVDLLNIGLPDRFVEHGSREDQLTDAGLDAAGIRDTIERFRQHPDASQDGAVVSLHGRTKTS
ncbi:MAG TPA: 1-deoxy-D-xylulose-5-phosphate synthase [Gammaproteobacteria bacterium]|nr:1-deoxy-D-xylulose-5-phosphate synthase [Gammaproteobacteria bacterium]